MQLTRDPTTGESFARFDIRDYGATAGDGTDDARAIQAAIDAARDFGPGARVVIEGGEYLSNSALFVHSHTYLHLDESATLLKGYVSGAAQAFIRTAPAPRGLTDIENDISNGLRLAENVTITGGGTIEMASKALDGSGSYGPVILVAGSEWNVNNITIDGYYSTPSFNGNGDLIFSSRPESDFIIEGNGNAIGILVVGDDHVLSDLRILDGSHSHGTTGIRIFSGRNIYVSDSYIESGDDMLAAAPVQKFVYRDGELVLNSSPLNQGDIEGVHFHNITGFSSAARVFAAIDGHPQHPVETWGNEVSDITLSNIDAISYKGNHAFALTNALLGENGLVSGINIIDSTIRMDSLPDGLYDYVPRLQDYSNARGFAIDRVPDIYMRNVEILGDINNDVDFVRMPGAADIRGSNPTIEEAYVDDRLVIAYSKVSGNSSGDLSAAQNAESSIFLHELYGTSSTARPEQNNSSETPSAGDDGSIPVPSPLDTPKEDGLNPSKRASKDDDDGGNFIQKFFAAIARMLGMSRGKSDQIETDNSNQGDTERFAASDLHELIPAIGTYNEDDVDDLDDVFDAFAA